MSRVLVTGAAGFIGFHLCQRLLADGKVVVGLDNLNDYYDVALKQARLAQLQAQPNFSFTKLDLGDRQGMAEFFTQEKPELVVHLAAQAGVRHSLENPHAYVDSNLVGFVNVLEGCRHHSVNHLVYASSSSVYGAKQKIPFAVTDNVDQPVSLYAATKKANELMAHTYSHLYGLPTTGLRFFTVYGPWGRPDMAYFSFTKAILAGKPIKVFNQGQMRRDFTYIDDVVEGLVRVLPSIPPGPVPYLLYNIGNHSPVALLDFIQILEDCLGKKGEKVFLPMQPGDVVETYADVSSLMADVGFSPSTPLTLGLNKFIGWYRQFYGS
ncbi:MULTISPECIES: NAD-dependent epimerase [unclassified Synechocystis]|uniref:NAD-dependent epimerase n=1 Tax=unclassified Synechocystis TaxID=2640012 RepID=UPI00041044F8|nr:MULTISPECIES: NAD-dependent epimerase [unclassified Synechocystis]AIE74657.1 dTDP-glucose 4,6-dehydratase [Synechocystis sp. PCC 6714]MCT0253987.1 NAD-dependent epimerase [Synechocystis sp. CS-94]